MIFLHHYFLTLAATDRSGILPVAGADHTPSPLVEVFWHDRVPAPRDGQTQAGRLITGERDQHLPKPHAAGLAEVTDVKIKNYLTGWPIPCPKSGGHLVPTLLPVARLQPLADLSADRTRRTHDLKRWPI